MALLQSTTLTNQDISSALLVGTYTTSVNRPSIMCQVLAAQVAGNGLYTIYATRQINGAGAAYEYQGRLTALVESGVTSIIFPSIIVPALANDVVKVYLVGLAGDTTTPDITCEFWDLGLGAGAGATAWDVTITVSGLPREGVEVWITTDSGGLNRVASGTTDTLGNVTFYLDPGTYYVWKQLAGVNFTNPESMVVT